MFKAFVKIDPEKKPKDRGYSYIKRGKYDIFEMLGYSQGKCRVG